MEAINPDGGPLASTGQKPHLTCAPTGAAVEHPDVLAWFEEAKRLLAEAEERFESGKILPAISSLAAVPPLHSMLIERCSVMLDEATHSEPELPAQPSGMYL
jgi:hypothetical protein